MQRRQNRERGVITGHSIRYHRADNARIVILTMTAHPAGKRLPNMIEGRPIGIGAVRPEARNCAIDKARILGLQRRKSDPQLLSSSGAEVHDDDICRLHQYQENSKTIRPGVIERDRSFIMIVGLELRAVQIRAERSKRITGPRSFYLDDVGSE